MKVKFNTCSLLAFHFKKSSIHFIVWPEEEQTVYKFRKGKTIEVDCLWIWGRATEQYDCCLEYFGLGPLMLVCWQPYK